MYQYLLGKVSTDVDSEELKKFISYQYLLGKVSTKEKNNLKEKVERINIY